MARRIESHWLAGPAGRLEALLEEPADEAPRLAVVLCHPHPRFGGTMHNKVVYRMARGLRAAGAVVLRFNFRGVGASQGEYGEMAGEMEDARMALGWLRERYPELPFALAGFSFGARVITRSGLRTGRRAIPVGGGIFHAAGRHGVPGDMRGAQDFHSEHARPIRPAGGIRAGLRGVRGAQAGSVDRSGGPLFRRRARARGRGGG